MSSTFAFETKKRGNETLVVFSGVIDEQADFSPLVPQLSKVVVFDLAKIQRVNSEGVRRWINFIRALKVDELAFVRCSVPIVTQLNMIAGFQGRAEVRSFYAPYLCAATGKEEERLLTRKDVPDPRNPPTFPCDGGVLELDDIPERYFAFLLDSGDKRAGT